MYQNITFCSTFNKSKLCKTFITKKNVISYDTKSKFFNFNVGEFKSIEDLYSILTQLETLKDTCIIRAQPLNNKKQLGNSRRLEAETNGDKRTLEDKPLQWLCIDLDDDIGVDFGDTPPNQLEIPELMLHLLLPECFHNSDYVFQYSSSAGIVHPYKGHFWFLLENPLTSQQLRNWHKSNPVCDPVTFKAGQPHYTATPIFSHKVSDPIKKRTLLKIKDNDYVYLDIPTPDELSIIHKATIANAVKIAKQLVPNIKVNLESPVQQWRVYLSNINCTVGAHQYLGQATSSFQFTFGVNADWNYFKQTALHIMQMVGHPRARYPIISKEIDEFKKTTPVSSSRNLTMNADSLYLIAKLKLKGIIK